MRALALLFIEFGLPTSSHEMMSTEPGKATTDKEGEPVVYSAKADMEPIGNSGKDVAMMNA